MKKNMFYAILTLFFPSENHFEPKWLTKVHLLATSVFCEVVYYANYWLLAFVVYCGMKTKRVMKEIVFLVILIDFKGHKGSFPIALY